MKRSLARAIKAKEINRKVRQHDTKLCHVRILPKVFHLPSPYSFQDLVTFLMNLSNERSGRMLAFAVTFIICMHVMQSSMMLLNVSIKYGNMYFISCTHSILLITIQNTAYSTDEFTPQHNADLLIDCTFS